jgi:chromosome segregation ATPase
MPIKKPGKYSGMARLGALPFSFLLLGFLGFGLPILLQELPLWLRPPTPEIVQLTTATTMTPEAQKLFYRQDPTIEPKATFAQSCSKVNHGNDELVALGCFRSMTRGGQVVSGKISIQSIADSRFQGIMEVTAAHEMLHAVYVRLSPSEQAELAPRLAKAALRVKDNRLASVLKQYKNKDLQLYYNELHSHLGTELADLGDEALEKHYRRYFTNRQQVVALATQSQTAFRELDDKAQTLKAKIDQLEINLKAAKQSLQESEQSLESGQNRLDSLKSSLMSLKAQAESSSGSDFNSLAQQFESSKANFNVQVGDYNAQVQQHQGEVDAFNEQLDVYKKTVADYNAIAKEERSLLSELRTAPQKLPPSAQ